MRNFLIKIALVLVCIISTGIVMTTCIVIEKTNAAARAANEKAQQESPFKPGEAVVLLDDYKCRVLFVDITGVYVRNLQSGACFYVQPSELTHYKKKAEKE